MIYMPLVRADRSTDVIPLPLLMLMAVVYTSRPAISVMITVPFSVAVPCHSIFSLPLVGLGKADIVVAAVFTLATASVIGVISIEMVCCMKDALLKDGALALTA